jgi:hypothetical protein
MEKTCSRCKLNKLIVDFGRRKDSKDGYHGVCKECRNKSTKKWRESDVYKNRVYTEDDIINEKNRRRKYYIDNKEDVLKKSKEYRNNNKDKYKEYKKNYYNINREKLIEYSCNYHLNKIKNDNIYKFQCNIKCLINNSIKYKGYKKVSRTNEILCCSISEFKLYIESKFESWMTWDNHGLYNGELNYGWDIDHIIPTSSAETEEEIIKLNHYTNLQPLCGYINRNIKRNKLDYK